MRARTGMASTSPLPSAILVHEYVTGGGWPAPDLPPGLAEEALAILRALLADLRAWGRFPVVTTHDGAGRGSRRRSRRRSLPYGPARTCPRLRRGARRRPGGRRCSRTPELAGVGRWRLPARQPAVGRGRCRGQVGVPPPLRAGRPADAGD